MKKCRVLIKSTANGAAEEFEAVGCAEDKAGRIAVSYLLDGDKCVFCVNNGEITHERRGSIVLCVTYIEGKTTQGTLSYGEKSGDFDLFTHSIKITNGKSGIKVCLDYDGADGARVMLIFTAIYIREKK